MKLQIMLVLRLIKTVTANLPVSCICLKKEVKIRNIVKEVQNLLRNLKAEVYYLPYSKLIYLILGPQTNPEYNDMYSARLEDILLQPDTFSDSDLI